MRMNLLSSVDGDEISPVERAANRRRFALLKGDSDMPDAELQDMLAIPWEHEGEMIDQLRQEGADESVQKAMLAVVRLAKGIEDELPEHMREVVEKLGEAMYSAENPELNKDDGEPDGDDDDDDAVEKRDFSTAERQADARSGKALPGGGFPIENEGDLKNAIHAIGRAKDRGQAMSHIKARARTLGLTKLLPSKWVSKADQDDEDPELDEHGNVIKEDEVAETTPESPAVSVPVQKEDGTWDLSNVPEEAQAVWTAVLKSNETLGSELQEAKKEIARTRDELDTREAIAKADEKFDVLAPASELGPVLKAAAAGMDEETYGKLEEVLSAAAERVRKGNLFEENGKAALNDGSKGDAYSTAVQKAKDMVEKSTDGLSEDAAIAKVFDENPDLYGKYLVELAGGVS